MSYSSYSTDSNIIGKLTISGDLQNKNKIFNTVSSPSLGDGARNLNTDIKDYSVTLINPLSETIVLDTALIKQATLDEYSSYSWVIENYPNGSPPAAPYDEYYNYPVKLLVTLPAITTGITVNFIKNNVLSIVTFATPNSDRIIRYGTEYQAIQLLSFYNTSIQLIGLSNNRWIVNDLTLPPQISNPVGSIITMSTSFLPNGYLECNGKLYPRVNYPDLFDVIQNKYGQFNNYFRVPNFNDGSFLRGYKNGITLDIGSQQSDNIKRHTHSTKYTLRAVGSSNKLALTEYVSGTVAADTKIIDSSNNTWEAPDETRPINYAVYYYIKY